MLLAVDNLVKRYPGHDSAVLDHVSLAMDEGDRVGLVGPSGCGKTTLARIIARLESADAGSIAFNGASIAFGNRQQGAFERSSKAEVRKAWLDMQMVFQNPAASFSDHMSLGDAIWEGAAYRKEFSLTKPQQRKDLIAEALNAVGLDVRYASKRAFELSGGECQRAAIARAIIGRPKLLVCDEATSSLDVTVQARVVDLLGRLNREKGIAVLFVSHNMNLVRSFCSRIYSL